MTKEQDRPADDTTEDRDTPVLVQVDSVEGMRLVTYHKPSSQPGAAWDAHRLIRRDGTIAGVYEGRVRDGLYYLVDGRLVPYDGPKPFRSHGA